MRQILAILLLLLLTTNRYFDDSLTLPWASLLILFTSAVFLGRKRQKERTNFVNQLKSQREALRKGGTVVVDNVLLRYESILTTYYFCIGGLISSVTVPSNYVIASDEEEKSGLLYSLVSLLSGWWAIPDGPIQTINLIRINLAGGQKQSVAELIDLELFLKKREKLKKEEAYKASIEPEDQPKQIP